MQENNWMTYGKYWGKEREKNKIVHIYIGEECCLD
jgi:hypothetical protein